MPTRLSLTEQYDNRDVVAQIYRLISLVESSTIVDVITSKSDDNVIVTLEMYDGTSKDFMFKSNGVQDITAVQSGSTETVTITTDDGTKWRFSFDIAVAGMTTDTQQVVTAVKTFTVSPRFPNGLDVEGTVTAPRARIDVLLAGEISVSEFLSVIGSVTLDGEVQITNGHSLAVAGDVNVAGDMQVVGNTELMGDTEIGGMAFEKSGSRTVMSNPNGISVVGQVTEEVPTTSTGLRNLNPANGTRVQNDLDAYQHMVRTTGTQDVSGYKKIHEVWNTDFPFRGPFVVLNGFDTTNIPPGWYKVFSLPTDKGRFYTQVEIIQWTNNTYSPGHGLLHLWFLNVGDAPILRGSSQGAVSIDDYLLVRDNDSGMWLIYVHVYAYRYTALELKRCCDWQRYGTGTKWSEIYDGVMEDEPVASETVEIFKLGSWQ